MAHLKIMNAGRQIEGLPSLVILDHEDAPEAFAPALAEWRTALADLDEAGRVLREAEKAAQESTLLVRGERDRWQAEIREKTAEEISGERAAARAAKAAAGKVVAEVEDNVQEIRSLGARLALEDHARAVDAAMDLEKARGRFRTVTPRVDRHPNVSEVDAQVVVRQAATNVQRGAFEDLDRVNVAALVDVAGEDPVGFVEVVGRHGYRLLTTERRAAALVGSGRNGWTRTGEEGDK